MTSPMRDFLRAHRAAWGTATLVALISLVAALSFGVTFGTSSNQQVYLLNGIRLVDPDFLSHDWWATETSQIHRRFAWLVAGLHAAGFLGWGLALGNVLSIGGALALIYLLIRSLDRHHALAVWLIVVLFFVAFDRTRSVAVTYLFSPSLQPSTVAMLFLIAAIAAFLRDRLWSSGALLAISGLFHSNFLILGFLFFGLANLLLTFSEFDLRQLVRRGFAQFLLPMTVLLIDVPHILHIVGVDLPQADRALANDVLVNIAGPHHYKPTTFLFRFVPFFGLTLLSVALFPFGQAAGATWRRFRCVYFSSIVLIVLATLLTTVVFVGFVASLFVWRLAPYAELMAHMTVGIAVLRILTGGDDEAPLYPPWRMMLAGLGSVLALGSDLIFAHPQTYPKVLLLFGGGGVVAAVWFARTWPERPPRVLQAFARFVRCMTRRYAVPALALVTVSTTALVVKPGNYALICPSCVSLAELAEQEIYAWARTTPPSSQFLIPPGLSAFRLFGERAVVADWKGRPLRPDELLEWYRRMTEISGADHMGRTTLLEEGYGMMTADRLHAVSKKYGVDYVVARRGTPLADLPVGLAFENTDFVIFRPDNVPRVP